MYVCMMYDAILGSSGSVVWYSFILFNGYLMTFSISESQFAKLEPSDEIKIYLTQYKE